MAENKPGTGEGSPGHLIPPAPVPLLRHCVVYEIELDQVTKGSPGSTHLGFALALLPLSVCLLLTLLVIDPLSIYVFVGYLLLGAVFFIAGLFCMVQWLRYRGSASRLLAEIKRRMQPSDIQGVEKTLP
jgi:hypothetical protein